MKYFIIYRKQSISILHRKSEILMNFRGTWPHAENQLGKGNVQQLTFMVLERKSNSFPQTIASVPTPTVSQDPAVFLYLIFLQSGDKQ